MGSVCKVIYEEGLPNIRGKKRHKCLTIYDESISHIRLWTRSLLNFLIYEETFFMSAAIRQKASLLKNLYLSEGTFPLQTISEKIYVFVCCHIFETRNVKLYQREYCTLHFSTDFKNRLDEKNNLYSSCIIHISVTARNERVIFSAENIMHIYFCSWNKKIDK
jgi:hypothetical protein